jgi:hypothetical protein
MGMMDQGDVAAMRSDINEIKLLLSTVATKEDLKSFATKEDLKSVATKEDLRSFATKEDLKSVATKEDLKSFATKEDLKSFATKEDLKSSATKEDLKSFATKEDLKLLATRADTATKDDLLIVQRTLALEIVNTNGRIDQLREDMSGTMRSMSSGFHSKIDRFMSEVGKVDRAQIIADSRVKKIEKRVSDIESRPS